MQKRHDEHYVRSIVKMGDVHSVVTNQSIFTSKKIKLIDKGVKVDSALFDRLSSHKLTPKIDQCLSVANAVTAQILHDHAQNLLDNDPGLSVLRNHPGERERILRAFHGLPLLPSMAFKLTVASTQRPEVYDHSIRVALVSLYLALRSGIHSENDLASLAAAAVFHDLGLLHICPDLMQPGRRLKDAERKHLYAHPITASMILSEYTEYHPGISRVVLEHHERLDGSGYPQGLKEDSICFGAQILMLAEVANTVFERSPQSQSAVKLSILLRLNRNKFNRELCKHLIALIGEMGSEPQLSTDEAFVFATTPELESRMLELAQVLLNWNQIEEQCKNDQQTKFSQSLVPIIRKRVTDLQRAMLSAGFNLSHPEKLIKLMYKDPEVLSELSILIAETRWQLAEIFHEIIRRCEKTDDPLNGQDPMIFEWLEQSKALLKMN